MRTTKEVPGVARFFVQKNGRDHRTQIAALARPVVVEYRRDAAHVAGGGIAGDQKLNELTADKWPHVRMLIKAPERVLHIALGVGQGGRSRRDGHPAQQGFRPGESCFSTHISMGTA